MPIFKRNCVTFDDESTKVHYISPRTKSEKEKCFYGEQDYKIITNDITRVSKKIREAHNNRDKKKIKYYVNKYCLRGIVFFPQESRRKNRRRRIFVHTLLKEQDKFRFYDRDCKIRLAALSFARSEEDVLRARYVANQDEKNALKIYTFNSSKRDVKYLARAVSSGRESLFF